MFPDGFELFVADSESNQKRAVSYDRLEFKSSAELPKAIIVGGESHGISDEARSLLSTQTRAGMGGVVNVPLAKGVESLNVVSAAAIVLFEMRRKLIQSELSSSDEEEEEKR